MKQVIHCPIDTATETTPYNLNELELLIKHLQTNLPVTIPKTFPRGTVMPDGRLDLCKQSLGAIGCQLVADALVDNITITSLLLGTNGIGDRGSFNIAKLIEQNQHLEIVYLGCNQITETGVSAITNALTAHPSVTGLWLKRNHIGIAGAQAVAKMLRKNRNIRTIDLVNTQIGQKGLAAIIEVLIDSNHHVERLYLGGNQIDAEEVELIAKLLVKNYPIKALFLNVNDLGDAGALLLAEALQQNRTLAEIGLASNGITPAGGIPLIEAMQTHPSLVNVDLGYSPSTKVLGAIPNSLGDTGAEAIGKLLVNNQTLLKLNLRNNGITERGKLFIIAGLEQNKTLYQLVIDGKQDKRIASLCDRNYNLNQSAHLQLASDVALIRSVARTTSALR